MWKFPRTSTITRRKNPVDNEKEAQLQQAVTVVLNKEKPRTKVSMTLKSRIKLSTIDKRNSSRNLYYRIFSRSLVINKPSSTVHIPTSDWFPPRGSLLTSGIQSPMPPHSVPANFPNHSEHAQHAPAHVCINTLHTHIHIWYNTKHVHNHTKPWHTSTHYKNSF